MSDIFWGFLDDVDAGFGGDDGDDLRFGFLGDISSVTVSGLRILFSHVGRR